MKIFSCIAHDVAFGLLEKETSSGYSTYELRKDALILGICEFPSHLYPKFSVSKDGSIAIYGGCNVYLIDSNQMLTFYEEQEEVSTIWFVDDLILVKCDTLLISRERSGLGVKKEYWHNEIIIFGILSQSRTLDFQDLESGVFQLNLDDFSVCRSDYPFEKLV